MKFSVIVLFCMLSGATAWWQHISIYQILVSSFKDSNGDGIGDLNGLTQKLDHFVDLGIDVIYLTPFYPTAWIDIGYDISNFIGVDAMFGTMEDFDRLMVEVKKRGLRVACDLVINHSSDEHPWFQKSIDRIYPYTDYYVWVDPKGYDSNGKPIVPNNWVSFFTRHTWTWNEKRKQFYLHHFTAKQPDLNLRNSRVKEEIKQIIKFWFDKGISGFRLDAPAQFMEDPLFRDEPLVDPSFTDIISWFDLKHIYTENLPETLAFVHEIRGFIDDYNKEHADTEERILFPEVYDTVTKAMGYYDRKDYHMTHFPLNFRLAHTNRFEAPTARIFDDVISTWLKNSPVGATPSWGVENHDVSRIEERFGEEFQDIMTITLMTLPGIAYFYYGQEIGMQGLILKGDQIKCLVVQMRGGAHVRDGSRIPMQWDNSINAGFSSNPDTWLPVHPNYWKINVETEKNTEISRYNLFKTLSKLKKSETMKYGDFKSYILSKFVYAYVRSCNKCQIYITILNLGTKTEIFNLHEVIPNLPPMLSVVASSINSGYKAGNNVPRFPKFPRVFVMRPGSGIVLTERILRSRQIKEDKD